MLKINDNFRVEKDSFNWILIETYEGVDKNKKPKMQERESFYPTLEKLCYSALDKSIQGGTLEKILESIQAAKYDIKRAIKEHSE